MNKVITINLDGRAYQLEEQGYDALRAYLGEAAARLSDDPGKAEIIADLEQAIAEKCDKVLGPNKTVVTAAEVQRIIEEMGPVEGDAKKEDPGKRRADASGVRAPHRLFLIRDGAVFAGVCSGLAAYFDIDVTIMRIIFIALTIFTGGFWVLLYLALALLVPYADTAEAMAQARGEPFTAEALVQRAKERWSEGYERVTGEKWDESSDLADAMKMPADALKNAHERHLQWRQMRKQQRGQWKQRVRAQRYSLRRANPALGLLRALLAVLWILAFISLVSTGLIFGWTIPGVPLWLMMVGLFVAYFAVTGPMKTARYAPSWSGDPHGDNYSWAYTEWDGFVDGITVLFLILAFIWAYTHVPQFYLFVHHPIGSGLQPFVAWLKSL